MPSELAFLLIGLAGGLLIGVGLMAMARARPPARRAEAPPGRPPGSPDTTVQQQVAEETHSQNPLSERFVQATTSKATLLPTGNRGSAPVAMLTAEGGSLDGQSFLIRHASSMTIGRFNDCDIAVPDAGVSRLHAQITHRTDAAPAHEFAIFDYSSTNGTILNDQPINAVASLQHGDIIAIGGIRFRFHRIRKG